MGLLRNALDRTGEPSATAATPATFWSWWAKDGAKAVAKAVDAGGRARVAAILEPHLHALAEGLVWDIGPGTRGAKRTLVVTASGRPALRPTARRWLKAAPAGDDEWAYSDRRLPVWDLDPVVLPIGERGVRANLTRFDVTAAGHHLEVAVKHPEFQNLPPDEARRAAMLLLDMALGEGVTDLWISSVIPTSLRPTAVFDAEGLRECVRAAWEVICIEDGAPGWVDVPDPKHGIEAAARLPCHPLLAPELDIHCTVTIPYRNAGYDGQPTGESATALDEFTGRLEDGLQAGRLVAYETGSGVRTFHLYLEDQGPGLELVRVASTLWTEGPVGIQVTRDPEWTAVARFR